MPDTDIEIIETHHNRKIDSPSGTALFLADSINAAKDNKMVYEFDRHNKHELAVTDLKNGCTSEIFPFSQKIGHESESILPL